MITAGIDCGAKNTKTVIVRDGKIIAQVAVATGFDQEASVEKSLRNAAESAGIFMEDIDKIYGTGSGKESITMAEDTINDIKAMGKGAIYFFPKARTVADVGAEEGRAAKLDDTGNPIDFAINEKCAAGAGAF
ncbi:MAG: 2-hydroxyglutaryl-CoA dehydratase, partial [Desulfatitalea sp.]|nr:2-hydroxyglutaryl-CoA dehydratase [Desulfatitalea sp.]